MEQQLFIFTRTLKVDYGILVSPTTDFCPINLKKFFKEQVRGLLNTDEYTPDFTTPRWLLTKVGNYTLWGMGCWNEVHGSQCVADEAGRHHLRNFVGILYKGEVREIPFDPAFFSSEFNRVIAPIWNVSRMELKVATGVKPENYNGRMTLNGAVAPGLNLMPSRSYTHDASKAPQLFAAALVTKADISVATGILDIGLAFDDRYQFMNVCVKDVPSGRIHQFKKATIIPESKKEEKLVPSSPMQQESNKKLFEAVEGTNSPTPLSSSKQTIEEKKLLATGDDDGNMLRRQLEVEKQRARKYRMLFYAACVVIGILLIVILSQGSDKKEADIQEQDKETVEPKQKTIITDKKDSNIDKDNSEIKYDRQRHTDAFPHSAR